MRKDSDKPLKFDHGFIVAIDGPAGAGKSTVSKQLAEALGGMLLDTGGMYRGIAYFALKDGLSKASELGQLARKIEFDVDAQSRTLLVNGQDLGTRLRSAEVSELASAVSRFKSVRSVLTTRQRGLGRQFAKKIPVVVEGRDIGTVVFPKAPFKFFVTASAEVRAERRLAQLKKQGATGASLKSVLRDNEKRDEQDSTRKIAPLRCPEDAVVVDTSSMGISQVVRFMRDHIRGQIELHRD